MPVIFKLPVDPQREVRSHGDLFSYPEGTTRKRLSRKGGKKERKTD
jgi:hypothetical protein